MNLKLLKQFELPTIALIIGCYGIWFTLSLASEWLHPAIWIVAMGLTITLFWSLTHEVVHGHPTDNFTLNRLLVLLPIGWVFPYERFRDTHMQHHETGELTDPFDDPESWYLPQSKWMRAGSLTRALLIFNNTLLGRMVVGPIFTLFRFYWNEIRLILDDKTQRSYFMAVWIKHILLCALTAVILFQFNTAPVWQHVVAAYLGLSFLHIRTFLEHQAAEDQSERTVIIERNCPIAFLFLFNNLHVVHHTKPGIPWYQLPAYYRAHRDDFLKLNNHYVYDCYAEVFRKYFLRPKESVPHPVIVDAD